MQATKGTDIGDWLKKLIGKDMTELKAGMAVLRAADLRVAASELRTLLRTIPIILGMQDEKKRSSELEIFQRKAETVIWHAHEAFEKVETPEEKIRAVEIAVMAITASNPCREASVLREELVEELEKIMNDERVLIDARHELAPGGSLGANLLDFKAQRQARVRAVLMLLVHCEAFAATNKLRPVLLQEGAAMGRRRQSFGQRHYPVRALLLSGVFYGATDLPALLELPPAPESSSQATAAITEAGGGSGSGGGSSYFSDKEASVVAALLGEDLPVDCGVFEADLKVTSEEAAAAEAAEAEEKAKREKAEAERKAAAEARKKKEAAEAEAKAAAAAKKKKEKEERERAEAERKAAAEALKKTQQGATLAPTEARAVARAALGAQERSKLDKELKDECYGSRNSSKGNWVKVKGMLDRGANPNGHKVRRT